MPSVFYLVDEEYKPLAGSLKEKIIDEIKKYPGEHSSRTLAIRLGITDPEKFDEFHHIIEWLVDKQIIRATWLRMEQYIERVVNNPARSITKAEILKGTKLAIEHAKQFNRSWQECEREIEEIERKG